MASAVVLYDLNQFIRKKALCSVVVFFFYVFVVSLATSKPGMNISAAVLSISSLSIFFINYKVLSFYKYIGRVFYASFLIYFLFAVVGFFHPDYSDLKEYLYKNLYIIVVPMATILLMDEKIRNKAIILLVISSFVASIYSIYNFVTVADFNVLYRTSGFLSSDRHLNCVILSFCVCLHYLLSNKLDTKSKLLLLLALLTFSISIIVSNTRGGWLAAFVSISYLIIRNHRRFIPHIGIVLVTFTLLFSVFGGNVYQEVSKRFASISNVSTDYSNTSRINMWKGGISYLEHLLEDQPSKVVFGGGIESSASDYFRYLDTLTEEERQSYGKDGERLGGTDFHMTFIDMTVKSGVVFMVTILGIFTALILYAIFKRENSDTIKYITAYLVGVFLWLPFYSIMQGYSAYIFTFAIAIVLAEFAKHKPSKVRE